MGKSIFQLTPADPIDSYGISEIKNAIVEGNNLCFISPINPEPLTYLCTNSGGVGLEHGFSYGNGAALIMLYFMITVAQYLYIYRLVTKNVHKTL
jgi:hypothetical protein